MVRDDISIVLGDLTLQRVDAIVNAANSALVPGGGVDGAIHRAAGPELAVACRQLGGCPTGEARITPGFRLPARWVIHTVGPVWRGGYNDEDALLARCYRSALTLAAKPEFSISTIAFPSIGTGAYGFPLEEAATIAIDEVDRYQATHRPFRRVTFVCFSDQAVKVYKWAGRALLE